MKESLNRDIVREIVDNLDNQDRDTLSHLFSKETIDVAHIAYYYSKIMDILQIPPSEDSYDTPFRVAKMLYTERCRALREDPPVLTTFPNENYDEYIVVKDIPFVSVCSHHHVVFSGRAHIIYRPDDKVLGISKFARVVEYFAAKPNIQENLTSEILDYLWYKLQPKGLLVKLEATHNCMTTRGVKAVGSVTVTQRIVGDIDRVEANSLLSKD